MTMKLPLSSVEQEMLEKYVKDVRYTQNSPRTIFCILVCHNGYEVYGASSCRNLSEFDEETGKIYSMKHALSRMYRKINEENLVIIDN